jgi:thymidylate synthase
LKNNPDSRRLMVTAWNPADLEAAVLPPCHYGFQCYTRELTIEERMNIYFARHHDWAMICTHEFFNNKNIPTRALSLKWTQRSCDSFLGIPFNIASYGLLLSLLANEVNMVPEELIFSGGDVHIYSNHIEQCKQQLNQQTYPLPTVTIANKSIFDMEYTDIKLNNYQSSPTIKGELSN